MKITFKKIIIFILIIVVLAFIVSRFILPQKTVKVDSANVVKGNLKKTLTLSGKVDADEKTTLRFQAPGRITWIGVKEGDYVQKYQSIASLDQRSLQKTLQKYLNTYSKTRDDFDQTMIDEYRYVALTDEIKRIQDKAQKDLNNSVLDVEIQTLSIEMANLWTPIEGIVTRVDSPQPGVNISLPTQAEFEIINPNTVYFAATADQEEVTTIREGMGGDLILDSYPQLSLAGTIKNISFTPKEDETGTVYAVKFNFNNDNTGYNYRIGMAGDLNLTIENKYDVLYLPTKYIKEDKDGKKYVYIMKNNKKETIYIKTGLETDDSTEITEGLNENDVVYD